MSIQIREAFETDTPAILDVVLSAFGNEQGQEIADLIIDLLKDRSAQPVISLVATSNDRVVAIFFLQVPGSSKLNKIFRRPFWPHYQYIQITKIKELVGN